LLLEAMGAHEGPIVSTIIEKGRKELDPANLPYLHKSPAV